MKTYPLKRNDGQIFAFEIPVAGLWTGSLARLQRQAPGVANVRRVWSQMNRLSFDVNGEPFVAWEPWGGNSRHCMEPVDTDVTSGNAGALEAHLGSHQPGDRTVATRAWRSGSSFLHLAMRPFGPLSLICEAKTMAFYVYRHGWRTARYWTLLGACTSRITRMNWVRMAGRLRLLVSAIRRTKLFFLNTSPLTTANFRPPANPHLQSNVRCRPNADMHRTLELIACDRKQER